MKIRDVTTVLKILLPIAVIFLISATATAAPSVCRNLPAGTQNAGDTIQVDLVVTLDGASTYILSDSVPAGWEITSAPGGTISSDKQSVSYAQLTGASDTTLTYYVKIPDAASAGVYSFSGVYGIGQNPMTDIVCNDMSVTVGDSVPSETSVCRNLPAGTQTAGSTIQVDLVVTLDGENTYMISDSVPAGWEITSAPGGTISSDKQSVNYAALGSGSSGTLSYDVLIPSGASAGTYSFSGQYGIGGDPLTAIDCNDMSVTVGDSVPSETSVCRNLPAGTQTAGSTIQVDLVVTLDGENTYMISDSVPAGWEITSAPGGTISSDKQSVNYAALGSGSSGTLSYDVLIPSGASAGTYSFSGQYGIGSDPLTAIDCNDMSVNVQEAGTDVSICRDLPDDPQSPDTTFAVDLIVDLDGETTYMIEEHVPSGWHITSAPGGVISGDQGTVSYVHLGDGVSGTLTYMVHIPPGTSPGTYSFSGTSGIGTNPMAAINCIDTSVEVTTNAPPTVHVDSPNGGEMLCSHSTIAATASDTDGTVVNVEFLYSPDGGSNWVSLANDGSEPYEFVWNTASVANGDNYMVKAVATDDGGATAMDTSDGVFTIQNPCPGIYLYPGWNFFSVPCVLENDTVEHVLEGVLYSYIYWYDASSGMWVTPSNIEPLTAYWIKVDTEQMINNINCGYSTPSSRMMYEGWNPVGLTGSVPRTAEYAFSVGIFDNNIDDNYSVVWGPWDPMGMTYMQHGFNMNVHDPLGGTESPPDVYTENYMMDIYEGHWIYMTSSSELYAIG